MTTLQRAGHRPKALTTPEARLANTADPGARSYHLIGGSALLLLLIGVVMVLSASSITSLRLTGNPYADFLSQARYVLIGIPFALLASRIPVPLYRRFAFPALGLGAFLQLLIFTPLGRGEGGNTNWIYIPGLGQTIQPSEFLKLGMALALGAYLSANLNRLHERRAVLPAAAMCLGGLLLVMAGNDMGTAIVLVMLCVGALWVAGVPGWWFAAGGLGGLVAVSALVAAAPSRIVRIMHFLGIGDTDAMSAGFQSRHGLWGLGTGGVSGVGLGASREKWSYLPAAHNDFIFAILGEELGLLGTLMVLLLFGVLAVGLFRLISRHPDPFVKITTAALACWIIGQALMNIGVVIGLLPVIGVPLPLVSAGGSAMISTLIALGVALAFARDEPGAATALSVSSGSVRRSLAVLGGSLRGRRG